MRERPILFSAPMVRAILDGSKTQTRRTLKNQPPAEAVQLGDIVPPWHEIINTAESAAERDEYGPNLKKWTYKCPYGVVGDRLWVKETHTTFVRDSAEQSAAKMEAATKVKSLEDLYAWSDLPGGGGEKGCLYRADFNEEIEGIGPWTPSIFMPRWASRITLEITDVRVERLKEISEADALAEGISRREICPGNHIYGSSTPVYGVGEVAHAPSAKSAYSDLWERINGPDSWQANPWVWVIEFKKLDQDSIKETAVKEEKL